MPMSMRRFIVSGAVGLVTLPTAAAPLLPLKALLASPWMANQVALTSSGRLFLGLPRYARDRPTPSLVRRENDGSLQPFPGNSWNAWRPGMDGRQAFVYLNSVHIFGDDSVWCVDRGSLSAGIFGDENATPQPGAQKLVQLHAESGEILRVVRFNESALPPGAQINDLRLHGETIYISDSGLGGILVYNLETGKTLRRLSGRKEMMASPEKVPDILAHINGRAPFQPPNSDLLEVTSDGKWLYWAAPTGPLWRIETRLLRDETLSDAMLEAHIEHIFDNNFSGGCAMDSLGNFYFCETVTRQIILLSPSGRKATLVSDDRLVRPDGAFISADRKLYVPVKQSIKGKFMIYTLDLPERLAGMPSGNAVA